MLLISRVLAIASALSALGGLANFFLFRRRAPVSRRLLWLTAAFVASILMLKLAFRLYSGEPVLLSTIVIDTMQSFSLDASYDGLTDPPALFSSAVLSRVLPYYIVALYSIAPIAGGAVIYDVLAGVSPSVTLYFHRRRRLFIFSAMNDRSVTLAEDILRSHPDAGTIVFTGLMSDESDDETGLRMRARALGAISLTDDILHCRGFRRSRKCFFFLMNDSGDGFDDEANLAVLRGLMNLSSDRRVLWNRRTGCNIFLFTNDNGTVENVRSMKEGFDEAYAASLPGVSVHVVRDYLQACCMLMKTAPLYAALGPAGGSKNLRVVLFGNNAFTQEMFRTVYWCGQLLDTQLTIAVVYERSPDFTEDRPQFEAWLRHECPELLSSARWDNPDCLRIYPGREEYAAPYCGLSFIEADVYNANIRDFLAQPRPVLYGSDETFRLADCDCFLLLGEDDTKTISLAAALRDGLLYHAGNIGNDRSRRENTGRQSIAFTVRSDDLSEIVRERLRREEPFLRELWQTEPPQMHPFASLSERFSWQNVSLDGAALAGGSVSTPKELSDHGFADIRLYGDDIYDHWANAGRAFHLPYKMWCAGCLDADSPTENALNYYRRLTADPALVQRFFWLEHRRWSAFLRAQGFSRPFDRSEDLVACLTDLTGGLDPMRPVLSAGSYAEAVAWVRRACPGIGSEGKTMPRIFGYKAVPLRLHPCLVESAPSCEGTPQDPDLLDLVTATRYFIAAGEPDKPNARPIDIKKHDTPLWKYLPALDPAETVRYFTGTLPRTKRQTDAAWNALLQENDELRAYEAERTADR